MKNAVDDPEPTVQKQLEAYNARNLEALLALYSPDAKLFEHPSTLLASGQAEFRERFASRFFEPNLHADVLNRIVSGFHVIDHEKVTRTFPEGPGTIELVMIYEVQNGRITKAWTIPGPKILFA